MGRGKTQVAAVSAATDVSDKQRVEAFAANLLKLQAPQISEEINEQIASVLCGAVEELQWIADELEIG